MDIDTGTNELLCNVKDGVATITLNRPEARNAMSDKLTPALRQQIKARGDDDSVGAIVITGAGTAFCSGGDVKGMGGRGPRGQMSFDERLADLRRRQAGLTGALVGLRKPTIAAPALRSRSPATCASRRSRPSSAPATPRSACRATTASPGC